MTDEELIAAGCEIDHEATAKLRELGPPGCDGKIWVNRRVVWAGDPTTWTDEEIAKMQKWRGALAINRIGPDVPNAPGENRLNASVNLAGVSAHNAALQNAMVDALTTGLGAVRVSLPDEPVPDAPSEIAVTESLASWQQWAGYYSAYFERGVIPPPPHSAQLDAERARAEAAEKENTILKRQCEDWEILTSKPSYALRAAQEQIVRLMAERDEARNLLNMANDKLTKLQVYAPKPEPAHNPFREFGGDRRRVGS